LIDKTEKRFNLAAVNFVVAVALLIFAAWTTQSSYSRLYPTKDTGPFTPKELGEAIQAAAPNPDAVAALLVWNNNPEDYFYGNRPLKNNVWTVEDLQRRPRDDTVDLPFPYEQR
jgi:hypothetical protein